MKPTLLILFFLLTCLVAWSCIAQSSDLPQVGQVAPLFRFVDQHGVAHSLRDYRGRWVVLYFYPKDDTPGCTKEACSFRDDMNKLTKLGAQVIGVSVDTSESHAEFAKKYHLPFPLLADTNGKIADSYGALRNLGLIKIAKRYTFLINPDGKIAKTYLQVDTSRHSQQIVDDLSRLLGK